MAEREKQRVTMELIAVLLWNGSIRCWEKLIRSFAEPVTLLKS